MSIAQKIFELKRELAKHEGVVFTIEMNTPAYEALRREVNLERAWNHKTHSESIFGIKVLRNDWGVKNSYFMDVDSKTSEAENE